MKHLFTIMMTLCLAFSVSAFETNQFQIKPKTNRHVGAQPGTPDGREGGETIGTAFPINNLPFLDTGNTCDNLNDYEEACPWSSLSPDVVYSFTAGFTGGIDIDLCGSLYDTKVFVYEGEYTPGFPLACNDDFYYSDPCGTYVSFLENIPVTAGQIYYIVVDGYAGDCGDYFLGISEYRTDPVHLWSQSFGDPENQYALDVSTDSLGNVLVTGWFAGTLDFGGGILTSAGADIFVAKFDSDGNHTWSQHFGDPNVQYGSGIAVDRWGNIIVTGEFSGTIDFGGGPLVSTYEVDIFLVKFDQDGNHLWSYAYGEDLSQYGGRIIVDDWGNIFLFGYFMGIVDFGGGPMINPDTTYYPDCYFVKFDPEGNHLWSYHFGGDTEIQLAAEVAVDQWGYVVIIGSMFGTVDFGGGPLTSVGSSDVFVAKYSPSGHHIWSQLFGDAGYQEASSIITEASGDMVIMGNFNGAVDFGGGPLTSMTNSDIFFAKLGPNGNHRWSQSFGGVDTQYSTDIAIDGMGNTTITGAFYGTVDLGGGSLSSAGTRDMFVAKFDASGHHLYSLSYGDAEIQSSGRVAVDVHGHALLAGGLYGTMDFGGGPLVSMGGGDIYLAKLDLPPEPKVLAITDVDNDQGSQVRINFLSSSLDVSGSSLPIVQYEAYRRIDPLPPLRIIKPAHVIMDFNRSISLAGWEFVGAIPAHGETEYNMISPTLANSTETHGTHWSIFFIRAATSDPTVFFDSVPDSGFSIDNLNPLPPESFSVWYSADGNDLSWAESSDADFQHFKVYCYYSADPPHGEADEVLTTTETFLTHNPPGNNWYWDYEVSAVDFNGNESSVKEPDNVTEVDDQPNVLPQLFALHPNFPNPFNPVTSIKFDIALSSFVNLSIYNVAGQRVKTLINEVRSAGAYHVIWDGRGDDGKPAASGIYFYRLTADQFEETRRMVLAK